MVATESVVVKIAHPTQRKAAWLREMAQACSGAVQCALDAAEQLRTSSRAKLHRATYREIRTRFGLPADYARMAVNAAVSLARSYAGLRRSPHQHRTSFPKVNGAQGIGLGVNAYQLVRGGNRWILRCSTGVRGVYVWLPLCVPSKFQERLVGAHGDAQLFERDGTWYAMLPVRTATPTPTTCSGEPTFIGVDLGVVRLATVAGSECVRIFDGKAVRQQREHYADLRRRYQRHGRRDRVKAMGRKERRWMRDMNHRISRQIVDLAGAYEQPVIVLERLDGIRERVRGSTAFNRMLASWAFRQLVEFVAYKAAREGIAVVFVDPRGTSKTCHRCGHSARANRRDQGHFRCVACGYASNADLNAARNIAALGPAALAHGAPDTPPGEAGTENGGSRSDVV